MLVAILIGCAPMALADGDVWGCVGILGVVAVIAWARSGGGPRLPRIPWRVSWPGGRWRG